MNFQPVRGMRDLVGQDALIQETIESKFKKVFASYGYVPLYTPAVESFDLFKVKGAQGDAIKEEIYYFKDKSERELALRFELTASLARVVSSQQIKMPYKRYQIGEVYRYDRPQAKRYRAFTQADVDILGVKGIEAEIELMLVIRDAFKTLNLKPKIIYNSRKLLNDLLAKYAKGEEISAMRILDKMDKLEKKDIIAMLEEKKIDTKLLDTIEKGFDEIKKVIEEENKKNSKKETDKKGEIKNEIKESEGIKEILEFEKLCKENKIDYIEFDSKLARGFEYYTGIVFEIKLDNGPSVGGGGRFDKLIGVYGGQETPAIGLGFGVSRIMDYLKEKGTTIKLEGLFLFEIGGQRKALGKISQELREKGIFNEIDLVGKNISKNIEYAQSKGYVFVGILGENEVKENKITIKNIETGKQEMIDAKAEKILEWMKK